jgi:hypothetical protein
MLLTRTASVAGPPMLLLLQVLGNLPFNILVAVLYSGIFYGMCGLRKGPGHFGKFATIVTLLQIISAQVGY